MRTYPFSRRRRMRPYGSRFGCIRIVESGILFCDTDYIVRRVNACYAALLGGKVSSILGRPLTELNPATRAPIVIKNGKPELGDLCTLPLFGDNYKFVVNRVPVRDNQGDVIGMVSHILFTDPNELKELHDKIDLLQKKKKIYILYTV